MNKNIGNIILYVYVIIIGPMMIVDDIFVCTSCGDNVKIMIKLFAAVFTTQAGYYLYNAYTQRNTGQMR